MEDREIIALIKKYQEGTLSPDEKAQLDSWYADYARASPAGISDDEVRRSLERMNRAMGLGPRPPQRRLWMPLTGIAAVLALILGTGYYFLRSKPELTANGEDRMAQIMPGTDKAVLTLADGKKIALSSGSAGIVIGEQGIHYTDGTKVVTPASPASPAIVYQSVTTPRGGQYQVMLADGTRVWLNAESTLRYPAKFMNNVREVELEGEGFFEVAHLEGQPFNVRSGKQEIQVLATSFNVNAYAGGQAIKTTLVDGKVKVSAAGQSILLKPGFEAGLSNEGLKAYKANLKAAISWKSGMFYFDHADLKTVMGQLERWYDVEVVYQTTQSGDEFMGSIPRSSPLNNVLEILRLSGVKFRLEGRQLIVSD